ncbi:MAG: helix-turn-helix domain-containing protein [Bifidobacteriaceae bacterium]|jgi:predicted DNA-binding transcriptional regulator AlpA|nr:helix-turn-helix domain-containing protein [Bifidobacteriaceae bacterium]
MSTVTQARPSEDLLTVEQVMEIVHKSRSTLAQWRFYGRGPAFVKTGRSVQYKRAELDKWLDRQSFSGTSEYSR